MRAAPIVLCAGANSPRALARTATIWTSPRMKTRMWWALRAEVHRLTPAADRINARTDSTAAKPKECDRPRAAGDFDQKKILGRTRRQFGSPQPQ